MQSSVMPLTPCPVLLIFFCLIRTCRRMQLLAVSRQIWEPMFMRFFGGRPGAAKRDRKGLRADLTWRQRFRAECAASARSKVRQPHARRWRRAVARALACTIAEVNRRTHRTVRVRRTCATKREAVSRGSCGSSETRLKPGARMLKIWPSSPAPKSSA